MEDINKLVIVKHNDLIDAAQRLTVIEARILLSCIAQVNSKEFLPADTKFRVSATEIADLVGINPSDAYDKIKEAVARIYQREVIFLRPSKRVYESRVRWVFQIDYIPNEGVVELSFSPPIISLLSEIKGNFTQYKLENVLNFKCQYSFRLYELICRWGRGAKEIELKELRDLLQLEGKYAVWQDLKKWVIEPAVLEINELHGTSLTWEGIKKGREITKIKFKYKTEKHLTGKNKAAKDDAVVATDPKTNLEHYVELRRRFGDIVPIPEDIKAEMKQRGLW